MIPASLFQLSLRGSLLLATLSACGGSVSVLDSTGNTSHPAGGAGGTAGSSGAGATGGAGTTGGTGAAGGTKSTGGAGATAGNGTAGSGAASATTMGGGNTAGTAPTAGGGNTAGTGPTAGGGGQAGVPGKVSLCGGAQCASGQVCCLQNSLCVSPSDKSACPSPTPDPSGKKVCNSNADCDAESFCQLSHLCEGTGECISRTNCGSSSGGNGLCGCDGKTYDSIQDACLAGVTLASNVACGSPGQGDGGSSNGPKNPPPVVCGANPALCPAGTDCCFLTGECYAPDQAGLCTQPPPGTTKACLGDGDCHGNAYCDAGSCDGPGGCVNIVSSQCSGVLDPVCGCDGKSYTNAGCALAEGVRVASKGQCAP